MKDGEFFGLLNDSQILKKKKKKKKKSLLHGVIYWSRYVFLNILLKCATKLTGRPRHSSGG
jgi:hypothetical protein